mgnify:FL=1
MQSSLFFTLCGWDWLALTKEITQSCPEADTLFLKYQEAQGRLNSMTEYEMFAAGFRMGAQLMLEMLRD